MTTPAVRLCLNAVLPPEKLAEASVAALRENPDNAPNGAVLLDAPMGGHNSRAAMSPGPGMPPLAAMLYTQKRWRPGRTLKVAFFDTPLASEALRHRIRDKIEGLEDLFNLSYRWVGFRTQEAEVRINIDRSGGSWSYLGTDVLSVPKDEPTMNFGWFDDGTDDRELNRTAKHEFLHNAGLGHEHQNPRGGLRWNVPAVLRHYAHLIPPSALPPKVTSAPLLRVPSGSTQVSRVAICFLQDSHRSGSCLMSPFYRHEKAGGGNTRLSLSVLSYLRASPAEDPARDEQREGGEHMVRGGHAVNPRRGTRS